MSDKYRIWTCTVIVPEDAKLPDKPNKVPRLAVLKAFKDMEVPILFEKCHWEDGEVHHGNEDEILDTVSGSVVEGELLEPDAPEIDPDASTEYGDVSHGS